MMRIDAALKRVVDFVVALTALVFLAPVILACAIAIKVDSPGPVFYRARRVGRHGSELRIFKFRKMRDGAGGSGLTGDHDRRFTRIGRFLARTRLDELPQLINVLLGQMSIVGPRPEDGRFVALHAEAYREILTVRPGITGLCQLAFAKESEILDPTNRVRHYVERILPQKVALDCLYTRSRSIALDFRIVVWTFLPVLLRKDVAVHRATANLTLRRRDGAGAEEHGTVAPRG
jgi:lipopolysaccharide/colanic/teichoic acid biosynthesis glycosyltransferase